MPIQTVSSRDFTRDIAAAKRAAVDGPVLITDRGQPAFALLSIKDYYRLTGKQELSLLQVMDGLPGAEGIEFEAPRATIELKPVDAD
jgi:prevent-host-death family protein